MEKKVKMKRQNRDQDGEPLDLNKEDVVPAKKEKPDRETRQG